MNIQANFKGGGSFVSLPPQFSSNSEYVFVAWKNKILCYNSKTSKLISEFKGIIESIVGFAVHIYDTHECITACAKSGEVITWKVATQFKLINKKLDKGNIKTFHLINTRESNEIKCIISYKNQNSILFAIYDFQTGFTKNYSLKFRDASYCVDVSSKFFAVCYDHRYSVVNYSDFSNYTTQSIEKSRLFTCLSCHPEEDVLTGDSTGRVVLWQKIFSTNPTQAIFHWHTLPVQCLGFSTIGSYFYSGGAECVMVRWQADSYLERKFLPRLPSSIKQITVSPDNIYIALGTSDNAVKIVNSRFDNVSLIQHLVIGDQFESGIMLDTRTKALIMNGNVGQIQFYSPNDGTLLYNVDVVGQNKITNERNCKMESTRVTKVSISKSGLWMATVEERKDVDYSNEVRLKFWQFDLENQNFKLNTSIEYPHEHSVHSILLQPINTDNELKCVTVGNDRKFRIWQLVDSTTIYSKGKAWKCLCTGFYRDLPCKSLAFSIDGSLAAISFNEIITTWLPDACELKCSLVHPSYKEEIDHLQFGISNQCHLIVAASKHRLFVWNLLTLTLIWTVPVKISHLFADTITTNMAAITTDNNIYVFSPMSPEPIFSSDILLKSHGEISAAAFVPSKYSNDVRMQWYQRSSIFFINQNMELFSLGTEEDSTDTTALINDVDQSLFSMMIPNVKTNKVQQSETLHHNFIKDATQKSIKKYFEAPLHTMIPIRYLCASLIKSVVLQKS